MKNLSVLALGTFLVGALGVIVFLSSATISPKVQAAIANSGPMVFGPNGWGGWSCPEGTTVVGGGYEPSDASVQNSLAWKPGATVGAFTYPTTPFGYTYAEGETGWIVQNNNDQKSIAVFADCEPPSTPTPTVEPTPQGNGFGLPGDGLSDGRSDGGSSCPSCTQAPKTNVLGAQTGQVLGATTDFAGTGVADEIIMNAVGMLGGISTAAGLVLSAKKKLHI
jgi:hypothetical protein